MLGFRTDDPRSCGILELDDRDTVVAFHEKVENPPGNLANGAVYIFEPEVIDDIAGLGKSRRRSLDRNHSELSWAEFYALKQTVITGTSGTRKACAGRIPSLSTSRARVGPSRGSL